MDREAWHAVIHGVAKSWTRLSDWTELKDKFLRIGTSWYRKWGNAYHYYELSLAFDTYHHTLESKCWDGLSWFFPQRDPSCWERGQWKWPRRTCGYRCCWTGAVTHAYDSVERKSWGISDWAYGIPVCCLLLLPLKRPVSKCKREDKEQLTSVECGRVDPTRSDFLLIFISAVWFGGN